MRRSTVLLVFVVFLAASSATAQPTVSVRGNVGAAFFQAPDGLNNVLNSGVNLGLGAGVQVYRGLEVVVEGSYDRFTLNGDNIAVIDDNLSVGTRVEGGGLSVLSATFGLRYTVQSQSDVRPYAAGGVGLHRSVRARANISQGDETLPRRATVSRGYYVGLGSTFRIDDTYRLFFEPRLVIVDADGPDFGTNTSTRYVTVRLGAEIKI